MIEVLKGFLHRCSRLFHCLQNNNQFLSFLVTLGARYFNLKYIMHVIHCKAGTIGQDSHSPLVCMSWLTLNHLSNSRSTHFFPATSDSLKGSLFVLTYILKDLKIQGKSDF